IFHTRRRIAPIPVAPDLPDITARLERFAWTVGLVALVTFAIAFGLSRTTARLAYEPVAQLLAATRQVRESGQYDVRARKTSDDEIGEGIDDFNQKLSEIDRPGPQLLLQ